MAISYQSTIKMRTMHCSPLHRVRNSGLEHSIQLLKDEVDRSCGKTVRNGTLMPGDLESLIIGRETKTVV